MKFKIGDRVVVRNWNNLQGTVAKIVEHPEYPIYVLFDNHNENDNFYSFTAEGIHDLNSAVYSKLELLTPLEKLL